MALELGLPARGDIKRILVIKWSAMGDVVIATAIMEDIRHAFPGSQIDLNTLPPVAKLFEHDPRFQEVIAIDVRKRGKRLRMALEWLRRVRAGRYDLVIDLQRTDHTRFLLAMLWLTGGAPRHRLGNRGGFPYTVMPEVTSKAAHALSMMRSVLEAAGIPVVSSRPVLYPSTAQTSRAREHLRMQGLESGRYAVFLPGSQAAGWLKRWGAARFSELAHRLRASGLVDRVAVIGGPDEVEECERIAEAGDFLVNLNGQLALLEIAPICEGAAIIVANDTGTAHLAAAADRPMLVLCGPTNPSRVKPIGDRVRAIQAQLACRNCYAKDCLIPDHHACMKLLTPEFVAEEVRAMLAGGTNPIEPAVPVIRC